MILSRLPTIYLVTAFLLWMACFSADGWAKPGEEIQTGNYQIPADAPVTNGNNNQQDLIETKDAAIDFEVPPAPKLRFGPYLEFGGRAESGFEMQRNRDLDRSVADAEDLFTPSLSLSTKFTPHKYVRFFLNMTLSRDVALLEKGDSKERRRFELKINRAYVSFRKFIKGLRLDVGRQKVKADRNWGYDKNLDGVSLSYDYKDLSFEGALSWDGIIDDDLINDDHEDRVNNYIFRIEYKPSKKFKIAPYITYRYDYSTEFERPLFFGLHSSGEIIKNLKYWFEGGYVRGTQRDTDDKDLTDPRYTFQGFGFDVGTTYEFKKLPLKPSTVISYAFGGGDTNPHDSTNRGFRQSGLHDNSYKINGLTTVNYYGEIFDPELSNMHIFTTGASIRPWKKVSLEFLYHYYFQHRASADIFDSGIDADPTGDSKGLGSEMNFILGVMDIYNFDFVATFGMFLPGKAFSRDTNTTSYLASVKAKYNF